MPQVDVTIHYLEMLSPEQLKPRRCDAPAWHVRATPRDPDVNRRFYRAVGRDWNWTDRLPWTDAEWSAYVDQPGLSTWSAHLGDQPVGYYELYEQAATGVEIAYFGLLPGFIGQGLGGAMLTDAVERAWSYKPGRVWLHTCSQDHPHALAHYQARGFVIYKTETQRQETASRPPD